jgi:hypothetical protein
MGLRGRGLPHRAAALAILAAGVSLFAVGVAPVQAAPHQLNAAPSAPSCTHQPNLNDPTNSNNKVLESYWFAIEHAGQTTTVCTVFGNVSSGDIVTAHFTLAPSTATGAEITLVTNTASSTTTQQTLFDCASFSVGTDSDTSGDPCLASNTQVLTVHVPDCGFQVDLVFGEPLATMTIGEYRTEQRWIDGQVGNRAATCTTPTPTPTPTATPSPSGGVGGATATPTPSGPSGGVQGITTPGTGSGGLTVPITGLILIVLGVLAIVRSSRGSTSPPMP